MKMGKGENRQYCGYHIGGDKIRKSVFERDLGVDITLILSPGYYVRIVGEATYILISVKTISKFKISEMFPEGI